MKPFEVVSDVHWIGALDPSVRIFDDLVPTRNGTTYNAYLVRGEKRAVVDTVPDEFAEPFMRNLAALVDPRQIDFIVVQHTEVDHAGCLRRLMEAAPQARVLATKPGRLYLQDILNARIECSTVEDLESVSLGGRTLRFIPAPFMHWPDTMFTWLPEERLLFSCDAFGTHTCGERMYDDQAGEFAADFHRYYDLIMRPYRDKALAGAMLVRDLDIRMICPGHGPILRTNPGQYVRKYVEWATLPERSKPYVAIFYVSAHGSTRKLAEAMAAGVQRVGVDAEVVHVTEADDARLRRVIEEADGLIFGAPTIVRDLPPPMWRALACLSTVKLRARRAAAFGSYGWSGETVGIIEQRLREMRLPVLESGVRVKFTPDEADLHAAREFGERFATEVLS